jgi:hypothetical protein
LNLQNYPHKTLQKVIKKCKDKLKIFIIISPHKIVILSTA